MRQDIDVAVGWDHPRSRGVYCTSKPRRAHDDGSSPLARGLHFPQAGLLEQVGIIPARAGFTFPAGAFSCPRADHPRSRGVYMVRGYYDKDGAGSSPLARGLHPGPRSHVAPHRIIPARAGFTRLACVTEVAPRDHPRSRGVYPGKNAHHSATAGSSPLARGLRPHPLARKCVSGIIPARAGFTPAVRWQVDQGKDHPRSRGVYR